MRGAKPVVKIPGAVVMAVLWFGCGGGNGTHKTSFPMKDEVTKPQLKKRAVPVARTPKDLVGGQLVAVNVLGAGRHAERIRKAIGSKPGDAFNADRVSVDIRQIWATALVEDVQVKGVLVGEAKVTLTYTVKPRAIVHSVEYAGNKGISDGALAALGEFKPGALLNMVQIFRLRSRIGEYYTRQGYLLATVKVTARKLSKGRVDIVFKIIERARINIAEIKFIGVSKARERRLLKLVRQKSGANAVGGAYIAAKFRRSLVRVTDYFYNRGRLMVIIREPKVSFLKKNKRKLTISVKIIQGKRFRIGKLAVKGKLRAPTRTYLYKLGLYRGQFFNRSRVVTAIKRLVAFHKAKGQAKPNIAPVTKINERRGTIDITFQIQ